MDGKWEFTVKTPMGPMKSTMEFAVADGVLTGTGVDGMSGAVSDVTEGTFDGTAFAYKLAVATPFGEMVNEFAGTVEGDKIVGTAKNMMGTSPIEGVRI